MTKLEYTAEAGFTVTPEDTARRIALTSADAFPEVFATSRLVALMELAAARAMRPMLEAGQLSVGVSLNVRHKAATPVGAQVRAVATYLGTEGRQIKFRVEAFDEAGLIGDGEHARAIIEAARLVAGAEKRRKAAPAAKSEVLQ
jgi:fluoroacetyl-CoA thioesterase